MRGRLKHQRVNAHREAAQFNGVVSGRPTSAWGQAIARLGPPDTTFFVRAISRPSADSWVRFAEFQALGEAHWLRFVIAVGSPSVAASAILAELGLFRRFRIRRPGPLGCQYGRIGFVSHAGQAPNDAAGRGDRANPIHPCNRDVSTLQQSESHSATHDATTHIHQEEHARSHAFRSSPTNGTLTHEMRSRARSPRLSIDRIVKEGTLT